MLETHALDETDAALKATEDTLVSGAVEGFDPDDFEDGLEALREAVGALENLLDTLTTLRVIFEPCG